MHIIFIAGVIFFLIVVAATIYFVFLYSVMLEDINGQYYDSQVDNEL